MNGCLAVASLKLHRITWHFHLNFPWRTVKMYFSSLFVMLVGVEASNGDDVAKGIIPRFCHIDNEQLEIIETRNCIHHSTKQCHHIPFGVRIAIRVYLPCISLEKLPNILYQHTVFFNIQYMIWNSEPKSMLHVSSVKLRSYRCLQGPIVSFQSLANFTLLWLFRYVYLFQFLRSQNLVRKCTQFPGN